MARRIGSHSLAEFPLDVVRIECRRCDRAGAIAVADPERSNRQVAAGH
jgi:hypothetical protein